MTVSESDIFNARMSGSLRHLVFLVRNSHELFCNIFG